MTEPKHELNHWVRLLINCSLTRRDESAFIAWLHGLARRQLERKNIRTLAQYVLAGYDIHELAYMFIENLVLPKDDISCHSLYRTLNSLPIDIASATLRELEELFGRIIAVAIRDSLHSIYSEWDASYSRVHRAVEDHLRNNEQYRIIRRFKEKLGCRACIPEPIYFTNSCPREELLAQLTSMHSCNKSIGALVDGLFDFVERDTSYAPALSVYDISLAVRDYFSLSWSWEYTDMTYSEDRLVYAEIACVKTVTIEHIKFGVLSRYIAAGSMSEEEAQKMLNAVGAHLEDIINYAKRRLYYYFVEQYPDIHYDEYRTERRSRFEYIMHLSEEYFVRKCREVFCRE